MVAMSNNEARQQMLGLVECPHCREELVAPLAAAGRPARCTGCGQRFILPAADMLFTNAAAYLVENEVEQTENDVKMQRQLKFLV